MSSLGTGAVRTMTLSLGNMYVVTSYHLFIGVYTLHRLELLMCYTLVHLRYHSYICLITRTFALSLVHLRYPLTLQPSFRSIDTPFDDIAPFL